jgi:hypothetical protein
MKFRQLVFPLFTFVALLFFTGCNDLPTDVGYSMLFDTLSLRSVNSKDNLLIASSTNLHHKIQVFNSGSIYVGRTDDLFAVSMLRFGYIPDSLDYLTVDSINAAYIIMYPTRYAYGDSISNAMSFDIFKINKYWTSKTNDDSLFNGVWGKSDFFDTKSLGSYNTSIKLSDVMNPIKVDINKDLMIDWFKLSALKDTTKINWGIALVPNDNSNVIHQFSAQAIGESNPHTELYVIYRSKTGKVDTINLFTAIDASVVCSKRSYTGTDMVTQGSVNVQNKLTFDFSSIPPESAILSAQLELTLNESKVKKGNYLIDSLVAGGVFFTSNIDTMPKYQFYFEKQFPKKINDKYYSPYLTPKLNQIVEEIIRNGGKGDIVIYPAGWSMVRKIDQMAFYGPNDPNPDLRPKLRIIYSNRFKK